MISYLACALMQFGQVTGDGGLEKGFEAKWEIYIFNQMN
jgi:hypothetical protein